jgi:hypothetical protein
MFRTPNIGGALGKSRPNAPVANATGRDSDRPMSYDEVIASAQQIVDQLRDRWRESGLPISVLAHQMIGAGITDLTKSVASKPP